MSNFLLVVLWSWGLIAAFVILFCLWAIFDTMGDIRADGYATKEHRKELRAEWKVLLAALFLPVALPVGVVYGVFKVLGPLGTSIKLAFGKTKELE